METSSPMGWFWIVFVCGLALIITVCVVLEAIDWLVLKDEEAELEERQRVMREKIDEMVRQWNESKH